ncbi:hypothetical protein [Roseateles amylovorans]|uniref:DUF342 domain-containing protein n=1 Tax=Roseateles amylovorans TaxID=2978473 RepID=A0ABY6B734_9BURK|nr:hypothetical protein [Roseateles amylovorans]UXH80576.1 hypothetical protein N4261_12165 [Roseateles amylovorans]
MSGTVMTALLNRSDSLREQTRADADADADAIAEARDFMLAGRRRNLTASPSWVPAEDLPAAAHDGPLVWRRHLAVTRGRVTGDMVIVRELLLTNAELKGRLLTARGHLQVLDGARVTSTSPLGRPTVVVDDGVLHLCGAVIEGGLGASGGEIFLGRGSAICGDVQVRSTARLHTHGATIQGRLRLYGGEVRLGRGTTVDVLRAEPTLDADLPPGAPHAAKRSPMTIVLDEGVRIVEVQARRPLTLLAHRDAVIENSLPAGVALLRQSGMAPIPFTPPVSRLLHESDEVQRTLNIPDLREVTERAHRSRLRAARQLCQPRSTASGTHEVSDGTRLHLIWLLGQAMLWELQRVSVDTVVARHRRCPVEERAAGLAALVGTALNLRAWDVDPQLKQDAEDMCRRSGVSPQQVQDVLDRIDLLEPSDPADHPGQGWRIRMRQLPPLALAMGMMDAFQSPPAGR